MSLQASQSRQDRIETKVRRVCDSIKNTLGLSRLDLYIRDPDYRPISEDDVFKPTGISQHRIEYFNVTRKSLPDEALERHADIVNTLIEIVDDETRLPFNIISINRELPYFHDENRKANLIGFLVLPEEEERKNNNIVNEYLQQLSLHLSFRHTQIKADTRARILTQLEDISADISAVCAGSNEVWSKLEGYEVPDNEEDRLLLYTTIAACKIVNSERTTSHVGIVEGHQLDEKRQRSKKAYDWEFYKFLRYRQELVAARTKTERRALTDRFKEMDWQYTLLDDLPNTPSKNKGYGGYVAAGKGKASVYISDVSQLKDDNNYLELSKGTNSQLTIPIRRFTTKSQSEAGEILGILTLEHKDKHGFSNLDRKNLDILATIVGSSLSLLRQQRRDKALIEARNRFRQLAQTASPPELARASIAVAKKALNAPGAGIYLLDKRNGKEVLKAVKSDETRDYRTHEIELDKESIASHLFGQFRERGIYPHLTVPIHAESRFRHEVYMDQQRDYQSVLKVVMYEENDGDKPIPLGVLDIDDHKIRKLGSGVIPIKRWFTQEDAQLLEDIGKEAGIAIKHAREIQKARVAKSIMDFASSIYNEPLTKLKGIDDKIKQIPQELQRIIAKTSAKPDFVTLYYVDPVNIRYRHSPPVQVGLKEQEQEKFVRGTRNPASNWSFFEPEKLGEVCIEMKHKDKNSKDPDQTFMKNFGVKTYIAIKVPVSERLRVIIYLNFRESQDFTDNFIEDVFRPLGEGIRDIVLYLQQRRGYLRFQEALQELSNLVEDIKVGENFSEKYQNLLVKIAENAFRWYQWGEDDERLQVKGFSFITEYDGVERKLEYVAAYHPEHFNSQELVTKLQKLRLKVPRKEAEAEKEIGLTAKTAYDALKTLEKRKDQISSQVTLERLERYCNYASTAKERDGGNIPSKFITHFDDHISSEPWRKAFRRSRDGYEKGILSQYSIPLISAEELVGILTAEYEGIPDPLADEDRRLLRLYAETSAMIIRSAREIGHRSWLYGLFRHEDHHLPIGQPKSFYRSNRELKSTLMVRPYDLNVQERLEQLQLYFSGLQWLTDFIRPEENYFQRSSANLDYFMNIRYVKLFLLDIVAFYRKGNIQIQYDDIIDYDPDKIFGLIDGHGFCHSVNNLIRNAITATRKAHGEHNAHQMMRPIVIRCGTSGKSNNWLFFEIIDYGVAFDTSISSSLYFKNKGYGLALTKTWLKRAFGRPFRLRIYTMKDGKRFRFKLPLVTPLGKKS